MYRRISPPLIRPSIHQKKEPREREGEAYLVVEPASRFEVVEEGRVRGAAPKVHVGDLKVTPDYGVMFM